jgi:peptidoglycan/xylan/chitin deacetylase (PgdA/CDA1 family)
MRSPKRSVKRALAALSSGDVSGAPILVYHSVGGDSPASLDPNVFVAQVEFLSARFALASAAQLCANDAPGQPPRAALTFDDGFRDCFEFAFPSLAERNIPFTVFVATGFIDGTADLGWSPHYRNLAPLSWAQIRELHSNRVEIGAHTVTHPKLAACSSKTIRRELSDSRKRLEDVLGDRVVSMAYPFGQLHDLSETVVSIVEEAGYDRAYTTFPDLVRPNTSRFLIPRITVDLEDELLDLRQKVEGRRPYMRSISRLSSVLTRIGVTSSTSDLRTGR